MTYSLLQGDDYIGPLATISGFGALLEFVKKPKARCPELFNLLDNGYTDKPNAVAHEAANCASLAPSDVRSSLQDIYKNLRGKSGRVYIGDV